MDRIPGFVKRREIGRQVTEFAKLLDRWDGDVVALVNSEAGYELLIDPAVAPSGIKDPIIPKVLHGSEGGHIWKKLGGALVAGALGIALCQGATVPPEICIDMTQSIDEQSSRKQNLGRPNGTNPNAPVEFPYPE